MGALEIMFDDLNEDAQKEVLGFYGIEELSEMNFEVTPLFVLEVEE